VGVWGLWGCFSYLSSLSRPRVRASGADGPHKPHKCQIPDMTTPTRNETGTTPPKARACLWCESDQLVRAACMLGWEPTPWAAVETTGVAQRTVRETLL
jgi:hypothetical protein